MTSYLLTFTVYTTAMIGAIFLALFAYKKFSPSNTRISASKFLEVEDSISIGVRKQLYVVRAGDEKFLIASDADRTTFLSKLNKKDTPIAIQKSRPEIQSTRDIEFDMSNLYSREEDSPRKDATAILRNIISSGERK